MRLNYFKNVKNILSNILNFKVNRNSRREGIFTKVYSKYIWGEHSDGRKFYSGPGTANKNTKLYIEMLTRFIQENKIKTIFEIGCGDFSIMRQVLSTVDVHYLGGDIVKDLINYNTQSFSNDKINFTHIDAVSATDLPKAQLCVIRQVLQHLSNKDISEILNKLSHFNYVIITEHIPLHPFKKNSDKTTGSRIRLDKRKPSGVFFDAPPFILKHDIILNYREDQANTPAAIQSILLKNKM